MISVSPKRLKRILKKLGKIGKKIFLKILENLPDDPFSNTKPLHGKLRQYRKYCYADYRAVVSILIVNEEIIVQRVAARGTIYGLFEG